MALTPILGITQVSTSQSGKETTINDGFIALEAATNAKLNVDLTAGNYTLSGAQATRNYIFNAINAPTARTLNFPIAVNGNTFNRVVVIRNSSGQALTVKFASGTGTTVVVPNGQSRLVSLADGLNVSIAADVATVATFISLPDSPGTYASAGGKLLAVNMAENAVEFVDSVTFPDFAGNGGKYLLCKETEDGVEWVDASSITSFLALTDTPSDYTGQEEKWVRVNPTGTALEFVDAPTTEAVEYIAAARWRINVLAPGLESQVGFGEIEFLDNDDVNLVGAGTADTSNEDVGFEAELAFDGNTDPGVGWLTEEDYVGPLWIEYEFPAPVTVRSVRLHPITSMPDYTPTRIRIEYWDGTDWVSLGERETAAWEDMTPQTFTVNGVAIPLLPEAPEDSEYYARRNAAWVALGTAALVDVSDAPYSGDWDGSLELATKNALFDKIEALSGGGGDGIPEAPADGKAYGRKDNTWVELVSEVITVTGTSANLLATNVGKYQRWTADAAKTLTVRDNTTAPMPDNGQWDIRNVGIADLTLIEDTGVTINIPNGGSLSIPQGGTAALKRIGVNEFDLLGQTVAAP